MWCRAEAMSRLAHPRSRWRFTRMTRSDRMCRCMRHELLSGCLLGAGLGAFMWGRPAARRARAQASNSPRAIRVSPFPGRQAHSTCADHSGVSNGDDCDNFFLGQRWCRRPPCPECTSASMVELGREVEVRGIVSLGASTHRAHLSGECSHLRIVCLCISMRPRLSVCRVARMQARSVRASAQATELLAGTRRAQCCGRRPVAFAPRWVALALKRRTRALLVGPAGATAAPRVAGQVERLATPQVQLGAEEKRAVIATGLELKLWTTSGMHACPVARARTRSHIPPPLQLRLIVGIVDVAVPAGWHIVGSGYAVRRPRGADAPGDLGRGCSS